MIGERVAVRLVRRQERLAKKLARVRAKLASHMQGSTAYRVVDNHSAPVAALRGIATGIAWAAFWWVGCKGVNSLLDGIFGPEERLEPVSSATQTSHGQTFWTFGRRMRSGQTQISR